jgi:hypothetical protein
MGLILLFIWAAALALVGLPGVVMTARVIRLSTRNALFWLSGLAALLVSVAAQYWVAVRPYVQRGEYDIYLMTAPILSYYLAAPAVLAGILWFGFKARRSPVLAGATAGLLLSMTLAVALAWPLTSRVAEHFHLRFRP